ncbi:hypothetical protein O163_06705 [Caldanaerobacter subterraneus subsp. yonseiensis KB-1]|uniref:Type I-B CRISPR-associated protein Cas8b1/Cst1 n=1 Tax=Caldanaerobacter subterraneus subsp. yonseiensis KB-1 TaxID=1388761 RepID=U5CT82_CALSX|nr:hypothetical protein [Caldanaerobacter subterraneus]ERM92161.1 hypothetical protein O163_06705 [Caldanaerobacter subterraneus subsp. yonseiensis KB-1]
MTLPVPIRLKKETYKVYKTGLPFYDAARLIGVAHLFFGTASAEVKDKGAYWEVSGVAVGRDENQIIWVLERLEPTKKEEQLFERNGRFLWDELSGYFSTEISSWRRRRRRKEELKAEYDAALQIGTRGIDPLRKYEILAPRSTGETKKKFKDYFQEVAAATLGRAFAAYVVNRSKRQTDEMYILPIFRERFVISGFLTYERIFQHAGGGWVAAVMGALSILLDLTAKRLPVADFAYTREVKGPTRQPIFSSSGYLGLERLCAYWWDNIVQKGHQQALQLLRNFRQFLHETRGQNVHEQVQHLARWVAEFVANPSVDAIVKIEQLKARILAASQSQNLQGAFVARQLLGTSMLLQEVRNMMSMDLPEIPQQVAEALARALSFDEKGWMNQFTRLENAVNFSQFIQQLEHIISRGYYREQQEQGQTPDIRQALTRAQDLAGTLLGIEVQLRDEKAFRAWKAIFLLDVLSRARFRREISTEIDTPTEPAETSETTSEEN